MIENNGNCKILFAPTARKGRRTEPMMLVKLVEIMMGMVIMMVIKTVATNLGYF